jgi:hypothetical protein
MYHAKRNLKPNDLTQIFERYKKVSPETARNIVKFHERRMKQRAQENPQADSAGVQNQILEASIETASVPAPPISPAVCELAKVSA